MRLVKDLSDSGSIVFYWIDEQGEPISEHLATFQHAEDWWKTESFAKYDGYERRKSIIDRRRNLEKRQQMGNARTPARTNPLGRRATDLPISIDEDRFWEKFQLILQ